jgi:N-acetylmuramoyl-L-alanine amidase
VEGLPIFTARKAAASPPAKTGRGRWFWLRNSTAALGLALLLAGAAMLIPSGPDGEFVRAPSRGKGRITVVIDAGHGGHDNGAARNGLREKDLTLDTALRLESKLRKRGFAVVMTRRDDRFIDLAERCAVANRIPRALFVSIHFNDNATASGDGVETFYASAKTTSSDAGWSLAGWFTERPEPSPMDNGLGLARAVQNAVIAGVGAVDRGVKQANFAVVRLTRCPAVLVEGGFINNPVRARRIAMPEYRERLAEGIAEGVSEYQRQRLIETQKSRLAQAR